MSVTIVLELGSHSLKVHYQSRTSGIFRKSRFPWNLGHEVYSQGRISVATTRRAIDTIRLLRKNGIEASSVLAIATGALRDAANRQKFLARLEEKLDLQVRVISGREEASLLAQGYLSTCDKLPALITDIGGGSLELVYLGQDKTILRDSLPLGAIRVYHFGQRRDGTFDEDLVSGWIENSFQDASVIQANEIHCTGGTAKAIAKVTKKRTVDLTDLRNLEDRVRKEGPPKHLKIDRARVLFPGLVVLRKLMEHSNAQKLTYLKVRIGRIFLQKYARRVPGRGDPLRKQHLLRDLRITQIYTRNSQVGIRVDEEQGPE